MKLSSLVLSLVVLAFACMPKKLTTEEIIDKTIAAYGGEKVFNSVIEFDFRERHYVAKYHDYRFLLQRIFSDSTGNYVDELTNDGFTRYKNDTLVALDEEWRTKYSSSVNSVIYFFRIPFILKDPAVQPELIGSAEIKGQAYYKLRVSFTEEGGGEDFDDTFVYWINKETYHVDYFAYSYSTSGGGKRFREAINPREINGLRTTDYINYKPKDLAVAIEDYDTYITEGGFVELSRIINENITIEYLD